MKDYIILSVFAIILIAGCKQKKEEKKEKAISAISIIKGQLKQLDTSLFAFTKYETVNNKIDTTYLKREEAVKFAEPFLSLPEIVNSSYTDKYNEEKLIDAQQQTLNITATPTAKNDNAEIQKQILIIDLTDASSARVQSIFIDRYINSGDSTIEQKLFWEIDKSFSISSIIEKENQPDKTHFIKIAWQ
jgi:hypothetical protein